MKLTWSTSAWEDYLYWQKTDRKIVKKINDRGMEYCNAWLEAYKKTIQGDWDALVEKDKKIEKNIEALEQHETKLLRIVDTVRTVLSSLVTVLRQDSDIHGTRENKTSICCYHQRLLTRSIL